MRQVIGVDATVARPTRKTSVLLLGIPEWMSPEDITREVLMVDENLSETQVLVRDNIGGGRVVRLEVPMAVALRLAENKTVRIGWSRCRVKLLEPKSPKCFKCFSGEIGRLGLSLAVNKTEAVMFTYKYKHGNPALLLDGQALVLKQQIKYLGMVVDRELTFKAHTTEASAKAERTANLLARLMPNIGGPKQLRKKLYLAVTHSVLLYGSPSWAHTLEYVPGNVKAINRVQRKALLRSICAYRTVSETAANILSGAPPADLLARERSICSGKGGLVEFPILHHG